MTAYSGRLVDIAVGREADPGTLSDPTHRLILDQRAFKRMVDKQVNRNAQGIRAGQFSQHIFREHSGGPLSGYLDADTMGIIALMMFGQRPDTSGASPNYTHVWTPEEENVLVTPLSVYRKTPNYQDAFTKCRASKAMLKMAENSYTEFELDMMGFKGVANATAYPERRHGPNLAFFVPKNIHIGIGDTMTLARAQALSNANRQRAKTCNVNYTATLRGYPGLGDTDYVEIGSMEYDLNIEMVTILNSDTLRQLWLTDGRQAVYILMTGDKNLSTSTTPPTFALEVPNTKINGYTETEPNAEFSEQTLTFSAFYNEGDDGTFKGTLTNSTAEY